MRERERYVKTLAYVFIRNSIRKFRQKEREKIRFKVCTQSTHRNRISIDLRDRFFSYPLQPAPVDKFSSIHNKYIIYIYFIGINNIAYHGLISDQTSPRDDSPRILYRYIVIIWYILYAAVPRLYARTPTQIIVQVVVVMTIIIIYLPDFQRIRSTFLPSYYFYLFIFLFFILIRSSL